MGELECDTSGLASDEAAMRLAREGENRLPAAPGRHPLLRFLSHFHNVLIYVLLAAAAITSVLEHYLDAGVILAVVLANALIGFIQEGRAEQAMNAIRNMLAPQSSVLRDGHRQRIEAAALVPGDVVLLDAGERVPADLRLLQVSSLRIDEAILTGESVPVEKRTDPVAADAALGDRYSVAYSGTLVVAGSGRGVVVETGIRTGIGQISGMLSSVRTLATPLVEQMNLFSRWLTLFILAIAGLLLVYGYFVRQMEFVDLFMAVVGLSVAAIPEGLPAVLTITLAIGVQAMARRHAIVRRLPAIETLGSVSVICSDKTGTLTRNEMMVVSVVTASREYIVDGQGYEPKGNVHNAGEAIAPAEDERLADMARVATLCNDSSLQYKENDWRVEGDPMEGALLALAGKLQPGETGRFSDCERVDAIPFDASQRYMATLNHDHQGQLSISVKGAPERILEMSRNQKSATGERVALDRGYWEQQVHAIAERGQRVLAFASLETPANSRQIDADAIEGELTLLGLVGLIDPPRTEAIAAVAECREAGIRVKMITGDHGMTARAISHQIGLQNSEHVLTGLEIDALDDAQLAAIVQDTDIFARTSPAHKLRLVMALQSCGLVVAMTGDGVNDAPALKRADAGIAMGMKGSEAAKEASEFVLADDNFASIVAAVREGRTVFDNIKKVISWTLPTNGGEAMTIVIALFLGLSLPVTAIQILWINLITAVTLGLALAFEPTEANTMRRPPRPRNTPLLNGELVWHIVLVSALFVFAVFGINQYAGAAGHEPELARTMALNMLVVLEIFHLFFVRNIYGTSLTWKAVRGTRMVWSTVIGITVAQFAITYLTPLQYVFDTRAVPVFDGLLIVAVGVVFFAILEIEKQLRLTVFGRRKAI
ncbi:MAG: cation-transporting P-type ATPase [Pseudohongiellaceae bacterium]